MRATFGLAVIIAIIQASLATSKARAQPVRIPYGSLVIIPNGITITSADGTSGIRPGGANVKGFDWAINDARGIPLEGPPGGPLTGWSILAAQKILNPLTGQTTTGSLTWLATSTPGSQFTFAMETLLNPTPAGTGNPGRMDDFFNPSEGGPAPPYGNYGPHDGDFKYVWPVINFAGSYTGPTDSATLTADTLFDTSQFQNAHPGTFSLQFGGSVNGPGEIDLVYTPVPEPGTLGLVGIGALLVARKATRSRRR